MDKCKLEEEQTLGSNRAAASTCRWEALFGYIQLVPSLMRTQSGIAHTRLTPFGELPTNYCYLDWINNIYVTNAHGDDDVRTYRIAKDAVQSVSGQRSCWAIC
jgi:hypothetical protein